MLVPTSTTFLTGTVFLALYTSVVSAIPAAISPNRAGLLRREEPADQMCGNMEWMWRECWPRGGEMAYRDICYNERLNHNFPVRTNCPENHECMDIYDWHLDKTIMCVPILSASQREVRTSSGGQLGSSNIKVGVITPSMTMTHQVTVAGDLHGSVTAHLLSEKSDFILTPSSAIVGKIHGKDYTVCKGDLADKEVKSFECSPTGLYDLNEGDLIDFTWGMANAQKGFLQYYLSPPVGKK